MKTESEQSAYIERLHPDTWSAATSKQRLKSLQEIENHLANESGRDPCRVMAVKMALNELGAFIDEKQIIAINKILLNKSVLMYRAIDTTLHGRGTRRSAAAGATTCKGRGVRRSMAGAWRGAPRPGADQKALPGRP